MEYASFVHELCWFGTETEWTSKEEDGYEVYAWLTEMIREKRSKVYVWPGQPLSQVGTAEIQKEKKGYSNVHSSISYVMIDKNMMTNWE